MILFLSLVGLGAFLVLGGLFVWGLTLGLKRARESAAASASASPSAEPPHAHLPSVTRHVPHHPLSILAGCTDGDVHLVATAIGGAIDVGAPLYNEGNFAGCYHMYEGTAADIERRLGPSCRGPADALEAGRTEAASRSTASGQAWAMRDAFDGLLDVISRSEGR